AFYTNVNCHIFLPKLAAIWNRGITGEVVGNPKLPASFELDQPSPDAQATRAQETVLRAARGLQLNSGEQDHPPLFEIYVGRSDELAQLTVSAAAVLYITGIGGSGK